MLSRNSVTFCTLYPIGVFEPHLDQTQHLAQNHIGQPSLFLLMAWRAIMNKMGKVKPL